MKNYDQSAEINHDPNWLYIPDHPYRFLVIGGSGSSKTNVLLNVIKHHWPDIDKIHLYIKDSFEWKYQLVINGRQKVGMRTLKNPKTFIDYSETIDDVHENFEDYNPTKKKRVLIVFDVMIEDMESNKNLSAIATELLLRGIIHNTSLVFISQS